jgi:hypothetical protein
MCAQGSDWQRPLLPNGWQNLVLADRVPVIAFQFAKSQGGKDRPAAEDQESQVNAVNHFWRVGVKAVGNEARRHQGGRRHAEADRQLLRCARNGTGAARLLFGDVGIHQRVHARVLQ